MTESGNHYCDVDPEYAGILFDNQLKLLHQKHQMIYPFYENQIKVKFDNEKIISYGLGSAGYDIRIGNEFKIFTKPTHIKDLDDNCIDPKNFNEKDFLYSMNVNDFCPIKIPTHGYALGVSKERFDIPRNIIGCVNGKSTYARSGLIVNITNLEPGWKGYLTIEIYNAAHFPAKVYAGEGICHIQFHQGPNCDVSYSDRKGKYQDQPEKVVAAKV